MSTRDRKVTLSVSAEMADRVDAYAAAHKKTRSAVFEEALLLWYREQKTKEIEEYYNSMNEQEKAGEDFWCRVNSEALKDAQRE